MIIAISATIYNPIIINKNIIYIGIALGAIIGAIIACKIQMTSMPQLVAGFHSLVGLAAVLIAFGALISPESYGISFNSRIPILNLTELIIGSVIGAITFTGSIIAFC